MKEGNRQSGDLLTNNIPNKIHIIGSVGSGKTTLARELSAKLNIPYYELDNIMWKRHKSGDIRRTEEERKEFLHTIILSNSWIVEGVHQEEWVSSSFEQAELIIFLDTKYSVRTYRIMKRFLLQKLGREKANYKPTINIFLKMFKWNRYFEEVGKPKFFQNYERYKAKILCITHTHEIHKSFLQNLGGDLNGG